MSPFLSAGSIGRTAVLLTILLFANALLAQWNPTPNDTLASTRIHDDNRVTFQLYAPGADTVRLGGTDIPDLGPGAAMVRQANGVWRVTVGPIDPGSYRYAFTVDRAFVLDPRNPLTSQSNANAWSLLHIPGAAFMDTQDVPRGAVAEVTYYSTALQRFRRMHVYTPPGYGNGEGTFPVLYLLHGAFDSDDSWGTVGRAGFILDNLIAAGSAVPMVVVMPAGHTGPFRGPRSAVDEFQLDFVTDIRPYIKSHYRIRTGREHTALAGLSMGGMQTLNIAFADLTEYGYLGVFSSGVFGITGNRGGGPQPGPSWTEQHAETLGNAEARKGLRLFWFATGKDDFLVETSRATVAMPKERGFDVVYRETGGAHTWTVWREYLHEFAPQLFR